VTLLQRTLGLLVTAGALAAMVAASNAPMTAHRTADAVLRLAWSARPERIETCRQQTDEQLARLPQHMRQPVVCEGTTATYRLQVRIDDVLVADRVVRGGGLRQDRRLYVFDEFPRPPGEGEVHVRFDRVEVASGDGGGPAGESREDEVARRHRAESVPPTLSLERHLRFSPRAVVLVTYDERARELTVRSP
jgi:hypothetical protein